LLTNQQGIEEQVERLEVHYLANSDDDLRFALLSDWRDAPSESIPGDAELLATAVEGIARLNNRYGPASGGGSRFVLFHRRRVWNKSEHTWMGWERKRGKLHELNQLLRGSTHTTFMSVGGQPPEGISSVRYVITLDADTRLPRGAAHRLIGTMAHPLNRPRFDPLVGRVVEGYGVVQPRITPSLPTDGEGSCFQRTFSGPSGIDPYASAVSDVYQDLFREGSYTGKGIYEIDAFEAALADKVPENAMLSHDLFEGLFARTALATDVELFEAFPSHYEAAAARQHRWARGDWQLLPWLLGRGHTGSEPHRAVIIPAIGRWKILDNLRRTLSAPAAFLALLAGWLLPQGAAWVWSCFILATIAIPSLLSFVLGLYPRRRGISIRSHVRGVVTDLKLAATQIALTVTFLAYQTWLMSDPQPSRHHTEAVVGVGNRGTGRGCLHIQPGGHVSAHGWRYRPHRHGGLWSCTVWRVRLLGCGGPVHPLMDGGSGGGALDQPASAAHRRRAGFARGRPDAPVDCAPDLEVLRDICVTGGSCVATG
jgi:cyclic beta-1,2-glucan synthetase